MDTLLEDLLDGVPAVFVVGPRACGKTTTARRYARTVVRLDGPEGDVFRLDPEAALKGLAEPVLLDEWQTAPGVLGAVKRALDDGPFRPGRFLITGSAGSAEDPKTWPGTGRLVRVPMYPMTVAEISRVPDRRSLAERLLAPSRPASVPDLPGYVDLLLAGGFPDAVLHLDGSARRLWLDSYVEQLVTRDTEQVAGERDTARLRRYLRALASMTAWAPDHRTIYEAAGVNRRTALAYDSLLAALVITVPAPAWHSNRLQRLVHLPKRFVVDPALAASILNVDRAAIMRDAHVLGRLLETFVAAQLRPDVPAGSSLYHLRQEAGRHEIDLLLETGEGVIGIEVKAGPPRAGDDRHLRWLRDKLGETFLGGVVYHTGPFVTELSHRIVAAPICTLWG